MYHKTHIIPDDIGRKIIKVGKHRSKEIWNMAKIIQMRLYVFDVEFKAMFGGKQYKETDESNLKHPGGRYWLKKRDKKWWLFKEPIEWKRELTKEEVALLG